MKLHGKVVVLGLSLATCVAAYGQVDASGLLKSIQQAFSLNRMSKLFSVSAVSCAQGSACAVTATVTELFDSQHNLAACAVRAADIDLVYGSNPGGKKISITWTLVPPTPSVPPTNARYVFERPHGVIITRDDGPSTGGKADAISDTTVQLDHKFKNHHDETHFYPGVIQTLADGKTQALCFAGDPRMTND
ncbi:MAG TPA: hypothetical protein VLD35_11970 [Caldimonas sp.]|nr:hypothetical protein [Caldimonas sp.]